MGDFYIDRVNSLNQQIAKALAMGDTAKAAAFNREAAKAVLAIAVRTGGAIRASWEAKAAKYNAEAARLEKNGTTPVAMGGMPANGQETGAVVRGQVPEDREPAVKTLSELQMELNELVGMEPVKEEVRNLMDSVNVQQVRQKAGLRCPPFSYHCVFTGNPGTGKTTVARIVAGIYRELGILSKGHLVEADRASLVGEYQGHTAVKTNKLVDCALDGVLFIDEAYSLVNDENDSFGREAVNTLLKRIEDDRKRLVVIVAGYTGDMEQFISTNPGFRSRFTRFIEFPDYSGQELAEIYARWMRKYDYVASPETEKEILKRMCEMRKGADPKTFGNARDARTAFEKTVERHAVRISRDGRFDTASLKEIRMDDLVIS